MDAKATLMKLNRILRDQPEETIASLLATPKPATCVFCEFRPACEPYLAARAEAKNEEWPMDVIGTLADIIQLGNGKLMLRIVTSDGTENVPGMSVADRHPQLSDLCEGDFIGVFALWRSRAAGPYSESFLTTIHRLPIGAEGVDS